MRALRQFRRALLRDDRGTSLVEFALILLAFLMVLVGGFNVALLGFAASSMQYAVEAGARCASVNTSVCSNSTTTVAYALSRYASGGTTPTFVSSSATCGHKVRGTMTYVLQTGVTTINVPLTAEACFP